MPALSSSSSAPNTLGESNRGQQNQSIEPSVLTSAAVCRSPISPCSEIAVSDMLGLHARPRVRHDVPPYSPVASLTRPGTPHITRFGRVAASVRPVNAENRSQTTAGAAGDAQPALARLRRPGVVDDQHYDVIIIGTGAGGGTLAHRLAPSGKRILLLERGDYLPRERDNWDSTAVFVTGQVPGPGVLVDKHGDEFPPEVNYYVGGNTKFYGAALFRLRPEDFGELRHHGGISPAWPIGYDDLEPYYTQAEHLYLVHGQHGEDPTEGPRQRAVPPTRRSQHEPRIQQLSDDLEKQGLHPFHLPIGVNLTQDEHGRATPRSVLHPLQPGRRLPVPGATRKSDAQVICVDPALAHANVAADHQRPRATSGDRPRPGAPSPRSSPSSVTVRRRGSARTSWWSPAARSTRRRCCCARPTTRTRAGWPTAPTWSAGTTCGTTTWR